MFYRPKTQGSVFHHCFNAVVLNALQTKTAHYPLVNANEQRNMRGNHQEKVDFTVSCIHQALTAQGGEMPDNGNQQQQ